MIQLSAGPTYFYKVILPILGVALFSCLLILMINLEVAIQGLISFFIPFLTFGLIYRRYCYDIKKVSVDNANLYVSNFQRDIVIPLSKLKQVKENKWLQPRRVTIYLNEPSDFGTTITFLGYHESFLFFKTHPSVNELNSKIKPSKNKS